MSAGPFPQAVNVPPSMSSGPSRVGSADRASSRKSPKTRHTTALMIKSVRNVETSLGGNCIARELLQDLHGNGRWI